MKLSKYLFSSSLALTFLILTIQGQLSAEQSDFNQLRPTQEEQTFTSFAGHRTTHEGSNHAYIGRSFGERGQIEVEDGSSWMIKSEDRANLEDWRPGDSLMLLPNLGGWFSQPHSSFIIYNERTYDSFEVEFTGAPAVTNRFSRYIIDIYKPEHGDGTLMLNDGTVWVLSAKYKKIWEVWQLTHNLIIGSNQHSLFNYFTPDILINVNCLRQYIPSKCTNYVAK
jgi:hypothetical protein